MDPRYFEQYLRLEAKAGNKGTKTGGLSNATIEHYLRGLERVNRFLREAGFSFKSVYELMTLEDVEAAAAFLKDSTDFQDLNTRGNRMYSSAFSRYRAFLLDAKGVLRASADQIDIQLAPRPETMVLRRMYPRDRLLASQALAVAGYACEADPAHETFIAAATGHPYMEGHHLIPLSRQGEFREASLDCYANIVCLCPLCHRKLHFAEKSAWLRLFDGIYEKRAARLEKSGIAGSRKEFEELAFPKPAAASGRVASRA